MAYLYKKVIGGKPYYYLRVSKTYKGKPIVKDVAYLGNDASKIMKKLEKLSAYKEEIKKAYRNIEKFIQSEHYVNKAENLKLKENPYMERHLFEEIEAVRLHFNERFLKLDKLTMMEAYKNFIVDLAFNTTSIEGNTITLAEAVKLLKENLTPKNRTLREIYDLQNTERIFFELLGTSKEINHELIIYVHDKLLENIDDRKGYRTHDVRVFMSRFKSTPYAYIKTDMGILLDWMKNNKCKLHPLVLAGILHHKFEKIHPFFDGNGRVGRMLMNYIMLQNGYPPFIIRKSRRGDYLDALASADKADLKNSSPDNYKRLITYLAEEMVHSYWNNFLV